MTDRLYLDVHVLQTVPPSCVNRDDTGSPKTAVYGGVTRARVSSQSWKKAMRDMFRDNYAIDEMGFRTKKIVALVKHEIEKLTGNDLGAEKLATDVLTAAGLKIKDSEKGTDALFFMSLAQAKALAEVAVQSPNIDKNEAKKALMSQPSVDIALFGRMVADNPSYNTDACSQVAHAISTHKVANEFDYFTAVDDLSPEDSAGAGHIGNVEYNSATLYRYATVAVHQLKRELGDDTTEAVLNFVKAFALSMPTGKQNTFANRTVPDAMYITLRKDQPVNLVGAFEKPIIGQNNGYVLASAQKFVDHTQKTYNDFVSKPDKSYVIGTLLSTLGQNQSLNISLDQLKEDLENFFAEKRA